MHFPTQILGDIYAFSSGNHSCRRLKAPADVSAATKATDLGQSGACIALLVAAELLGDHPLVYGGASSSDDRSCLRFTSLTQMPQRQLYESKCERGAEAAKASYGVLDLWESTCEP